MPKGRPEKLTEDIKGRILKIQLERVQKGKPKLKAPAMRKTILKMYLDNLKAQGLSNGDIQRELNLADKKYFPGESSIQGYLREINPKLDKPDVLDTPWTIGSCWKHEIPGEFIPILLNEQKRSYELKAQNIAILKYYFEPTDNEVKEIWDGVLLTVRQARWFAKLYPLVIELAKKQYPDNTKMQHHCVAILARQYAHRERAAEILGKDHADTNDIDDLLMQGDLSFEVLHDAKLDYEFSDETKKKLIRGMERWQGYTRQEYERALGDLTDKQVDLLNEWMRSIFKGAVYKRDWEKAHPRNTGIGKEQRLSFQYFTTRHDASKSEEGE